jgi:hypothetical protein
MMPGTDHRPVWTYTIRLADVWRNEQMSFTGRRDAIVDRLQASAWFRESSNGPELRHLAGELAAAEDAAAFDRAWKEIVGFADYDRAWIAIA